MSSTITADGITIAIVVRRIAFCITSALDHKRDQKPTESDFHNRHDALSSRQKARLSSGMRRMNIQQRTAKKNQKLSLLSDLMKARFGENRKKFGQ